MQIFNNRVRVTLFNIYSQDATRHKQLINDFNIIMTEAEYKFLEDQKDARKGRLENYMDRKLNKTKIT